MKKIISIAISAIMLVTAGVVSAMPVMADSVHSPSSSEVTTQPTFEREPVITTVNSDESTDVTYTKESSKFTFKYTGDKTVTKWEFPNLVEGEDYNIISISDDKKTVVIELTEAGKQKQISANAVVKGANSSKDDAETDDDEEDSETKTDSSGTSPATGATMAGIAMAGTGAAMLVVSKKRKD